MKPMKLTLLMGAMTALATPAFAADFATLDTNADGVVDFAEYRAHAMTEGKTTTLAAQDFTRMSQGDALLTEDEFVLATALADQPYALQPLAVESVEPVETFTDYPASIETVEPPAEMETVEPENTDVLEPVLSEPVMTETPVEVDPAVAGEVETLDTTWTDIPAEEGMTDLTDENMTDEDVITPDASDAAPELEIAPLDPVDTETAPEVTPEPDGTLEN